MDEASSGQPGSFLTLPPELRLRIYDFLIGPSPPRIRFALYTDGHMYRAKDRERYKGRPRLTGLLQTCALLYREVEPLLYSNTTSCTLRLKPDPSKPRPSPRDLGAVAQCAFLPRLPRIVLEIYFPSNSRESGEALPEHTIAQHTLSAIALLSAAGNNEPPIQIARIHIRCNSRAVPTYAETVVKALESLCNGCQPGVKLMFDHRTRKYVPETVRDEVVAVLGGEAVVWDRELYAY